MTKMKAVRIADIRKAAKGRKPGYFDDVLARGRVAGDFCFLSENEWMTARAKHRKPRSGLGDLVAWLINLVTFGTLKECATCAKRRTRLNGVTFRKIWTDLCGLVWWRR